VPRVLIFEPHDDIRALFELVTRRLGYEPVAFGRDEQGPFDAAVIEPGEPGGMRLAMRMRAQGTPVIFASIFPVDHSTQALHPSAHLVKPFPLYQLEQALHAAVEAPPQAAAAG
jgi:CheY-like chemotaxis protein